VTLLDKVGGASTLLGLLLVLVTLFTSEQSRSLDAETERSGGGRSKTYRRIGIMATCLAIITGAALLSLFPIASEIIDTCCHGAWEPTFAVFLLVWLLLVPLMGWQIAIARSAFREGS